MLVHGGLLHACAKLYQNLCRRSTYMHLEEVGRFSRWSMHTGGRRLAGGTMNFVAAPTRAALGRL
jgi:hypothetical protein